MNDNPPTAISDQRLLAAMMAVNPPIEKLMADRLSLRQEMREAQELLELERQRALELSHVRDVSIPRYIALAKAFTVTALVLALVALGFALFTGLLEIKLPASLFASLILPLWIVDLAEQRFGKWRFRADAGFQFIPRHPAQLKHGYY